MARFHGEVGYGETVEAPPGSGKYVDQITRRPYYGDVIRNSRQLTGSGVNEDIVVSNQISILADEYAIDNFSKIKFIRWAGKPWTVTDVEVRSPRLILSLGSVHNGPTA